MFNTILQQIKDFWKTIQIQNVDKYHDIYDHGNNYSYGSTSTDMSESIDNSCESSNNSENDSCSNSDSDSDSGSDGSSD